MLGHLCKGRCLPKIHGLVRQRAPVAVHILLVPWFTPCSGALRVRLASQPGMPLALILPFLKGGPCPMLGLLRLLWEGAPLSGVSIPIPGMGMALMGCTWPHLGMTPLPHGLKAVPLLGMGKSLGALCRVHLVGEVHGLGVGHALARGWVGVVEVHLPWVRVGQACPRGRRWGRVLHVPTAV